jgi:predicted CXXCH cytochrome family protein
MTWRRCRTFLAVLLCSSAIVFSIRYYSGAAAGVHRFDGQCARCHLGEPTPGGKLLFVKEIDILCRECHQNQGKGLSHPSGIKPSFPMPPEMRLDWLGRMTCMTCHQNHGTRKYLMATDKTGKAFCISCHQGSILAKGKYGHEVISSQVHQAQYEVTNLSEPLDRESQECLGCHDGSTAKLRNVNIGSGVWNHSDKAGFSHPVGVDYQQAARKGRYRGMAGLKKEIRFFNGKLGCGSCHSLYSTLPSKLVMRNHGSALCLECHNK